MADIRDLPFRPVRAEENVPADFPDAPRVYLVRDESEWPEVVRPRSFRYADDGSQIISENLPDVDLTRESAVVVSLGVRPDINHHLEIDRLSVQDGILVVEATETLPSGVVMDMIGNPVRVLAVRPADLAGDEVRLRLRVELAPPETPPSWSACYVLVEGRTVGEVVGLLDASAVPEDAERDVSPADLGGWILITDPRFGLADADGELLRWSSAGRVVRYTVFAPVDRSRATLWAGGNVIWELSFDAEHRRLTVVGDPPFDPDAWADENGLPGDVMIRFMAPYDAVQSVTGWYPPLAGP